MILSFVLLFKYQKYTQNLHTSSNKHVKITEIGSDDLLYIVCV